MNASRNPRHGAGVLARLRRRPAGPTPQSHLPASGRVADYVTPDSLALAAQSWTLIDFWGLGPELAGRGAPP
jgi:hypothetical protein